MDGVLPPFLPKILSSIILNNSFANYSYINATIISHYMLILIGIFLAVLFICSFLGQFLFYRLLKIEQDDYYTQWEKDGSPSFFWPFSFQSGKIQLLGFRSLPRYSLLFKTPGWVKNHQKANTILKYLRLSYFIFYFSLITVFLLLLFSAST